MPRCAGVKPNGERCSAIVAIADSYCYAHDPARSEERKRNASRGGRSKGSREVAAVKDRLTELAEQVVAGELATSRAAVAGQLLNGVLRALELERKVRETDELEARVEELEKAKRLREEVSSWG